MSILPTITLKDRSYSLAQHRELIDSSSPFDIKKHQFKPVQGIAKLMSEYARACVDHIEAIATSRVDDNRLEDKFSKTYKRLDPQSTEDQFWKIEKTKPDSNMLRYTIAASKANGAWERLQVYKDPNEDDIKKANWQIKGFLPGLLKLYKSRKGEWQTKLEGPNLKGLGKIRSENIRNNNGLRRIHHTLSSQAQCLLDWHREYGMNGRGVRIGDYKLLVRKLNGSNEGKAYILTRDKDFKDDETANAFIVRTSSSGEISEIIQYSRKSHFSLRLVPSNENIFERAELRVMNKKKVKEIKKEIEDYTGLLELFRSETPEGKNIARRIDEISEEFESCEQVHSIIKPEEGEEAQKAKATLLEPKNLIRLGEKLSLLSRPTKEESLPKVLSDFYDYTGIEPGQVSFAFYSGGVNSTKILTDEDKEVFLRSFGPADLRRKFQKSGDSVFNLNDKDLEEYFKGLNIDITNEEQNNAICRWTLLNDPSLFHKLGIYVEKSTDPKQAETLHLICPSGRDLLRKLKTKIPTGIASHKEATMITFPNTSILKEIQDRVSIPNDPEKARRVQINSIEMFYELLKDIGFKIANPLETEDFIKRTLASEEATEMQEFLQSRIEFKQGIYTNELGLNFLEQYLIDDGYSNIERINKGIGGNATIVFKCRKDNKNYLVRSLTHKGNISAKRALLKSFAKEENCEPLLFKFNGINNQERTYEAIEDLSSTIK